MLVFPKIAQASTLVLIWSKLGRLNHRSVFFKSAVIFSNVFQLQKHFQNPSQFCLSKSQDSASIYACAYLFQARTLELSLCF